VLPGHGDLNPWGVRSHLFTTFAQPEEGVVFQKPTAQCGRDCTRREMRGSRYCLVPDGGVEGWSLRMYEAVALGCVPVLIAGALTQPELLPGAGRWRGWLEPAHVRGRSAGLRARAHSRCTNPTRATAWCRTVAWRAGACACTRP
jgi:hypothetical protein